MNQIIYLFILHMVLFSSKKEFNDVKAKIAQILLKKMTISQIIIIIIIIKEENKEQEQEYMFFIQY